MQGTLGTRTIVAAPPAERAPTGPLGGVVARGVGWGAGIGALVAATHLALVSVTAVVALPIAGPLSPRALGAGALAGIGAGALGGAVFGGLAALALAAAFAALGRTPAGSRRLGGGRCQRALAALCALLWALGALLPAASPVGALAPVALVATRSAVPATLLALALLPALLAGFGGYGLGAHLVDWYLFHRPAPRGGRA
jgi:hypothetical protein